MPCPVFFKLATSSRVESVLLELLHAIERCCPDSKELRQLAVALSRSVTAQSETRAAAIEILLRMDQGTDSEWARALPNEDRAVLAYLFQSARKDEALGTAVLEAFGKTHQDLPLALRSALIPVAAPLATESARAVFFASLQDANKGIRRECYRYVGAFASQLPFADALCSRLLAHVESSPALEEEALEAIDSLEAAMRASKSTVPLPSLDGHPGGISNLFRELRVAFVTDIDTSHETGMKIASAKEYVEFHFDEATKKDFLQSIKSGGSPMQRRHCAQVLKDSGVKLEARHFDGYKVLSALLADPTRAGIALFIRHLAQADTQKRVIFRRLMRALSLVRMAPSPGTADLLFSILDWAWKMKLYQLSERALFALHRVDSGTALAVCREWMSPPFTTRRLAIAAIELLKDMDITSMEPRVIALLREKDRYIRLSLLDALASVSAAPGENLQRAILQIFCEESDQEVASKVLDLLGSKGDLGMAAALVQVYDRFEDWKKIITLAVVRRIVRRHAPVSDPSLTEFLYRTLRSDPPPILARVLPVLLSLGDTYAPRVLGDLLARLSPPDMSALVRELRDELSPAVVAVIWSLLREEDSSLQEALGEVLPGTVDPRAQQLLVSMVRRLRTGVGEGEPQGADGTERDVLLSSEKETYKFEREHVRSCAVLFSDIQDYSGKAEELTPMEITALLQEYEGILLPIVDAHEGTLVKRMGDGHIFVFDDPLCAVLAGIRVQKALRRFNRFRPEKLRVVIRIGIHWGEVVERAGDVFGNTVNVASRLQAAAMGGTTCISQGLFKLVADWIHANDLGMIRAKGLRDPIHTWEPTEVALGLPAELDPLRKTRGAAPAAAGQTGGTSSSFAPGSVDGMIKAVGEAFQSLSVLSRRSARSENEAQVIDAAFARAWRELQALIAGLAKPT